MSNVSPKLISSNSPSPTTKSMFKTLFNIITPVLKPEKNTNDDIESFSLNTILDSDTKEFLRFYDIDIEKLKNQ